MLLKETTSADPGAARFMPLPSASTLASNPKTLRANQCYLLLLRLGQARAVVDAVVVAVHVGISCAPRRCNVLGNVHILRDVVKVLVVEAKDSAGIGIDGLLLHSLALDSLLLGRGRSDLRRERRRGDQCSCEQRREASPRRGPERAMAFGSHGVWWLSLIARLVGDVF